MTAEYPDDPEVDGILGIALLALVGSALVIGPLRLPYNFLWNSEGLLLWPLWMIGMTWLLFGLRATRRVLGPAAFLLFAWPPLLTTVAMVTQGLLVKAAITGLTPLHRVVGWFHTAPTTGYFMVHSGSNWVPVIVSEACSGADSVLGAAIMLPLLFAMFRGGVAKKSLLGLIAVVGALFLNLLRLVLIVLTLHYFGSQVAFDAVHPVLGFVLFALLGVALVGGASLLRLPLDLRLARSTLLHRPGLTRTSLAGAATILVFALLFPFLSLPSGAIGRPLPVRSSFLSAPLPKVRGFRAVAPQYFDDASILGTGAQSIAETYVAPSGLSLLAEEWSTPSLGNLTAYGFHDCLLFHGDAILASAPVMLGDGVVGTDYLVRLPGPVDDIYLDLEWSSAVRFPNGGVSYLRYAVASFPYGDVANLWPRALRRVHARPATGLWALAGDQSFGSWRGLQNTRRAIESFSVDFVRATRSQAAIGDAAVALSQPAGR